MTTKRSAMYPQGAGAYVGGVGTLNQAQGNVLAPPGTMARLGIDFSQPATWSWIWFAAAVGYVLFMYYGHGGRRGGVI